MRANVWLPPVLPLVALAIVGPMFGAGLGPIDDHEIPVLGHLLAGHGLEAFVLPDAGTGRFRPVYWLARISEVALWGQNASGWYLDRLALAIAVIVVGYALARLWLSPLVAGLAAALMLAGPQAEAFARLGPQEAYAVPLTLAGFALIGRRRFGWGLALVVVSAFTKEPFVFAALVAAGWAWWLRSRRAVAGALLAVSVAGAGIVRALVMNGGTTDQAQLIGFQIEGRYLYPFVLPVALAAGLLGARYRMLVPVLALAVAVGLVSQFASAAARAAEARDFQALVASIRSDGRPVVVHVPDAGYIEYALALRRYLPNVPMQLDASADVPGFGPVSPDHLEVTLPRT